MPVDFDKLVVRAGQNVFGEPITVTPSASQPDAPPYAARAIWTTEPADEVLAEGNIVQTGGPAYDVRLSEFAVSPADGDGIVSQRGSWIVFDVKPDSGGAAKLILKEVSE